MVHNVNVIMFNCLMKNKDTFTLIVFVWTRPIELVHAVTYHTPREEHITHIQTNTHIKTHDQVQSCI